MQNKKISINILIADRPYPMIIHPDEEEAVRKAAKRINEEIRQFKQKYEGKDKQDFLAMCALIYAVKCNQYENAPTIQDKQAMKSLENAIQLVDEALEEE